jgi:hypothetical protein
VFPVRYDLDICVTLISSFSYTIFQGARRSAIWIRLSTFRMYTIIRIRIIKLCRQQAEGIQNHENMNMFSTQVNAKPDIENIKGLNLAAVKLTTVQGT